MNKGKGYTIREVGNKKELNDFVFFPYVLYKHDTNWVPPLISEERKFYDSKSNFFLKNNRVALFVCYNCKEPVGRIAAIINEDHLRYHSDNTAFFGSFECVCDDQVAGQLLAAAETWVKERGAEFLRGPTTFSLNNISGLLVDGFDEAPFVMMPYNFDYYEDLLEGAGFKPGMNFFAYEVTENTIRFSSIMSRLGKRLEEQGITIRILDTQNLDREAEIIETLFNNAWRENWGFTPVTKGEALEDMVRIKPFLKPDLVFIAEYQGEPVAFSLALPDINQVLRPLKGRLLPFNWLRLLLNMRKIDQIRVVLMGVLKEHRSKGIDLLFYHKTVENSLKHGYRRAELSWILENNHEMNRVLKHINARKYKTYRIFEKKV
jgi:hypothetical protein